MNKSLLVSALLAMAVSGCGVSAEVQAKRDREQEERAAELAAHYKITVIDNTGTALRTWTSREYVEICHGAAVFVDFQTNKKVKVGGNFIVEQL